MVSSPSSSPSLDALAALEIAETNLSELVAEVEGSAMLTLPKRGKSRWARHGWMALTNHVFGTRAGFFGKPRR